MPQFEYLPKLTKAEFKAVTGILGKYGAKGLLGITWEIALFNLDSEKCPPSHKRRAERVVRELGALIERLDGFEELEVGLEEVRL